jgi:excisionase family DNA binding protein
MTLDDLAGRLTISVPEAGEVLGVGRDAAYAAAARGEIPTLRLGRSLRVPVPALLALLGATPDMSADPSTNGPDTPDKPAERAHPHGHTNQLRSA